jgi:hypothetical protein
MKAIIGHIHTVYNAISEQAAIEVIEDNEIMIYRGQVSKLYATLGIAQAYYTEIFQQLDDQGCITMLQRGSKSVDSVIVCHHEPSAAAYAPRRGPRDLTSAEDYANMIEEHRRLVKLVGGMDIVEAFRELDERVKRLEEIPGREKFNKTQNNEV